jgi:hypothetical protein
MKNPSKMRSSHDEIRISDLSLWIGMDRRENIPTRADARNTSQLKIGTKPVYPLNIHNLFPLPTLTGD